ncbi:MAG: SDR family NAD(P)-dependent oxidoreductase, partial [Myxococcales bacterium]|nr:SDR family NAD(P)-dependent oxidoreductase [Myxococcales bacterium]
VLVNNAGVFLDKGPSGMLTARDATVETLRATMDTNVYGPYRLMQRLVPGMMERGYGRVVNVSSGLGQLADMNGRIPGYRLSKAGLNVLTRVFSQEAKGKDVLINSICPGWVRSDMGGADAARSLEEGASGAVWAATLPAGGPTGGFFRDGETIEW